MSHIRIWLHCVWASKEEDVTIPYTVRGLLLKHMNNFATENGIHMDAFNIQQDHIHALINLGSIQSASEVLQLLKDESANWINMMKVLPNTFEWSDDYFALSVSQSQMQGLKDYINKQDEHHKKFSWEDEQKLMLEKYEFVNAE